MAYSSFLATLSAKGIAGPTLVRKRLEHRTDLDIATRLFDILTTLDEKLLLGSLYSSSINVPYIPLSGVHCEDTALARLLPHVARRLRCIPLYEIGNTVTFALVRPKDEETRTQLHMATGRPIRFVFAFPQEIDACIERHYGPEMATQRSQCL